MYMNKAQDLIATTIEAVAALVVVLDAQGRIVRFNSTCEQVTGYQFAELRDRPLWDRLVPPEERQRVKGMFARLQADSLVPTWEGHWITRDGERRLIKWANKVLVDARGHLEYLIATGIDISEHAQAEAFARRAQQQAIVAELGQQALAGTALDALMNDIAARIAEGLEAECSGVLELLADGRSLLLRAGVGWKEGLVGRATVAADNASQAGYTLLTTTPVVVEDLHTEARFQEPSWLRDRGVISALNVIIPGQKRPVGVLGIYATQARAFTQDDIHFLQAVANVLATAIERKQAEELLLQAQKMESVGQLTGGVAHDFNNLLTVIMGNLQMLDERIKGDPHLHALAQVAWKSARHGAELTQKLLAFSRRQPLAPKAINLNQLVAGMSGLLHRTLGENIAIETVQAADLWKTLADPGQVETTLLNLALNARDAMPEGGTLTIETANTCLDDDYATRQLEVIPGEYVMLAVTDTGTGMPAEVVNHAFEPFFTSKKVGEGSGLGLSMVYGFVKQSGGHIKIYSEVGRGTTVKLYLPRAKGGAEQAVKGRAIEQLSPSGKATVLIVEDDDDVRELAGMLLSGLGYTVVEAADGPAALTVLARGQPIDLLFTDLVMPGGMSGPALAREARRRHPALKVLFTSGYTEDAIFHHGRLEEGMQLISKPYEKENLAQVLRTILRSDHGNG